ncbi:fumarate/nitrate reduction transcriptional regulator Fnr [Chitinimonas sp. BJB300]|uniref:fumarate/nitrate reduction transcriptional regulator Fnr n=1 Tax=Chitinimonas sp. BJB300 TaxID=1559339 RepID=UPI000C10E660|nr:fumarate/nitrate reduction transcriptional regulator Fnr [Chitinimonas sp. BJB300]PHV11214.1 transcriptional regulator [Chitinimonas sp. BJB300]TSJ87372.1 fumarate/nitrate reduction transcriptional regulator Fnr [Chitinimonas sp. BJB300]
MSGTSEFIPLYELRANCSTCSLRELCLPIGLTAEELQQLDEIIRQRIPLKRGKALFLAGQSFHSLYAIRTGFFKTTVLSQDGRQQVTGFHMAGELLGLDALGGKHACTAIALEDGEVCELPFMQMDSLSRDIPSLTRHFYKLMSREIVRDQGLLLMLGNMRAEERLAAFLLNLSQRFEARGFSANGFHLRMTREEIGSYLGLKLETVSRTFSRLQTDGLIRVQGKQVDLLDIGGIRILLGSCSST